MPTNRTITNPVVGDKLTFVELASETNGTRTVVEVTLQPGGTSAAHFHTQITETFEVTQGNLSIALGKKIMQLSEGQHMTVSPRTVHRYFNSTDEIIIFKVTVEPGFPGFEQFLQIIYGLAADGKTTKTGMPLHPLHTGILLTISDTRLPGGIRLVEPLIDLFGRLGRRLGIENLSTPTAKFVKKCPTN